MNQKDFKNPKEESNIVILKANEEIEIAQYDGLESLQKAVGGLIEICCIDEITYKSSTGATVNLPFVVYNNEEFLLIDSEKYNTLNAAASLLSDSVIYGDVVFTPDDEREGGFTKEETDKLIETITNFEKNYEKNLAKLHECYDKKQKPDPVITVKSVGTQEQTDEKLEKYDVIFEGGSSRYNNYYGCNYMICNALDRDGDNVELYAEFIEPTLDDFCDIREFVKEGYEDCTLDNLANIAKARWFDTDKFDMISYPALEADIIEQAKEKNVDIDSLVFPYRNADERNAFAYSSKNIKNMTNYISGTTDISFGENRDIELSDMALMVGKTPLGDVTYLTHPCSKTLRKNSITGEIEEKETMNFFIKDSLRKEIADEFNKSFVAGCGYTTKNVTCSLSRISITDSYEDDVNAKVFLSFDAELVGNRDYGIEINNCSWRADAEGHRLECPEHVKLSDKLHEKIEPLVEQAYKNTRVSHYKKGMYQEVNDLRNEIAENSEQLNKSSSKGRK